MISSFSVRIIPASRPRSGPSPTIQQRNETPRDFRMATALRRTSKPFFSTSLPTPRMTGLSRSRDGPLRETGRPRVRRNGHASVSTPL